MVRIIAGRKGKGKTKYLLAMTEEAIRNARGTVVYLDKNMKHSLELDRRIRLINVFEFPVHSAEAFLGFLSGIISQDHDLEVMFLDSFLTLSNVETDEEIESLLRAIIRLGEQTQTTFVVSLSRDKDELPAAVQEMVQLAL